MSDRRPKTYTVAPNDSDKRKPLRLSESYLFSIVKPSYHVSTLGEDFGQLVAFPLIRLFALAVANPR